MEIFHESKIALESANREYTSVGSLSINDAFKLNQACKNVVREIWETTTKVNFPKDYFKPFHRPIKYIKEIGIFNFYSSALQKNLDKFESYSLDKVRYNNERAFQSYTNKKSSHKANEIINITENFIKESEMLISNTNFVNQIVSFQINIFKI